MAVYATFRCGKCSKILDSVKKEHLADDWPMTLCPNCGDTCSRVYRAISIQVPEGRLGNAKNNYTTSRT